MNTAKVIVVTVVLGAVLYGAYVMLNKRDVPPLPPEAAEQATVRPPQVQMPGAPGGAPGSGGQGLGTPVDPSQVNLPGAGGSASPASVPSSGSGTRQASGGTSAPPQVGSPPAISLPPDPSSARSEPTGVPPLGGATPSTDDGGHYARVAATGRPDSGDSPAGDSSSAAEFDEAWKAAGADLRGGRYVDALRKLTKYYDHGGLSSRGRRDLLDLLDQLAGTVIYAREVHLLEPAYRVRGDETLASIARQYNVPWQLLAKINGIRNPEVLVSGEELKVVPGPFNAVVDLNQRELTLFLQGMYAGRFPIEVGNAVPSREGAPYEVKQKMIDRVYYDNRGRAIEPGRPGNPYGRYSLDLGGTMSIHGSPPRGDAAAGCISLSPRDAEDVYSILSVGSKVTVR